MFFNKSDDAEEATTEGVIPLLPLRDIIVFPHMVVPLYVGREKSIAALEEAMANGKEILLAAQRKAKTNDPTPDDIFKVGTVGTIIQLLRLPDETIKVLVEGNTFNRCAAAGILCGGDAKEWFESGPVLNMTIRNNKFIECFQNNHRRVY